MLFEPRLIEHGQVARGFELLTRTHDLRANRIDDRNAAELGDQRRECCVVQDAIDGRQTR